jgi:pimeloyl-ACP methyl ester carboxylesterase
MKQIFILPIFLATSFVVFAQSNSQVSVNFPVRNFNWFMNEPGKTPLVKFVELSNRMRIEYVEQGDEAATPVIFLHGLSDSWRSYELVLPHLPSSIHSYFITQRGHGGSGKPQQGYRPADFAGDVALFMKQLKIESAIIVGHSMGATIAQRFALDYPEKTNGLVLIGSFATFDNKSFNEFKEYVNMLTDPVDPAFATEFQKSTIVKPVPKENFDVFVMESLKLPAHVWKAVVNELSIGNFSTELKKIQKPVLLIWGDKDSFVPVSDQHFMNAAMTNSKLVIYKETGHAVHWEEPLQFSEDLKDFIMTIRANSIHRIL